MHFVFLCLLAGSRKLDVVAATVAVSKSTNGIDCWPTIRTTIAVVYSWIGFCSRRAACAVAIRNLVYCQIADTSVFVYVCGLA